MSDSETSGGTPTPPAMPPGETPQGPPPPAPEPVEAGSLAVNLVGVIASPGAAFRQILARPTWLGALTVYIVAIGLATLVYGLNVDWETVTRDQFEGVAGRLLTTFGASDSQIEDAERAALNEVRSLGRGSLTLRLILQSVIGSTFGVHIMAIIFATLFYLMGSLGKLKLGRIYLDGFLCLLLLIGFGILSSFVRGVFGVDAREALPWQAGIFALVFMLYLWLLHRSVERQPDFKGLMAVYSHALVVVAVAALLGIGVIFLQGDLLTVQANEILKSNLGAILGMEGNGFLPTLLSSFDLFSLWHLAVAAVGFGVLSRLSYGAAAAITFLPWGFWTMGKLAFAVAF